MSTGAVGRLPPGGPVGRVEVPPYLWVGTGGRQGWAVPGDPSSALLSGSSAPHQEPLLPRWKEGRSVVSAHPGVLLPESTETRSLVSQGCDTAPRRVARDARACGTWRYVLRGGHGCGV